MERPRSMMVMPAPSSHKRTASSITSIKSLSKLQQPTATIATAQRSFATQKDKETIQCFLNNLRLLELHQQPDWPNATFASLSSNDSKTRFRCVEWTLYQLFRLHDQQVTAEKLQPFFPPLEPLQSVNLRAALYRCLNELKKNGILGREVILRKTMLDECADSKFWELCLSFSAVVLRKVTLESKSRLPIVQRLATSKALDKKDKESLLPLAVAHKSALSRVLSQKHIRRQSYIQMFDSMKIKEEELVVRKQRVETQPVIVESAEHAEELEMIEQEVSGKWSSDEGFKDAMINGDPAKSGDYVLLQPTDEFVANLAQDKEDTRRDSGVLEDLELQARAQNARVQEWEVMYAQLQNSKRISVSDDSSRASKASSLQFDKHQDLVVNSVQPEPARAILNVEPTPTYVSKYDEMLNTMREELRRAHAARREVQMQRRASGQHLARKPSITLDAVAGAPQLPSRASQRSVSPTFPFRPDMTKRVSSRSRSYQQPKVISQREPIPLKSEIFSPMRRTGSISPSSARSSIVASPLEETPTSAIDALLSSAKRDSFNSVNQSTDPVSLGVDLGDSPEAEDNITRTASLPGTISVNFAHRKSLSERTRMSMALRSEELQDIRTSPQENSPEIESSLAVRTRQSMAGISVLLPIRASTSFAHHRSSSVVPQISPPKQRTVARQSSRSFSDADNLAPANEARREITPRERLFEADAEYNSVFKSRPKIATSPPLTPNLVVEFPQTVQGLDDS